MVAHGGLLAPNRQPTEPQPVVSYLSTQTGFSLEPATHCLLQRPRSPPPLMPRSAVRPVVTTSPSSAVRPAAAVLSWGTGQPSGYDTSKAPSEDLWPSRKLWAGLQARSAWSCALGGICCLLTWCLPTGLVLTLRGPPGDALKMHL